MRINPFYSNPTRAAALRSQRAGHQLQRVARSAQPVSIGAVDIGQLEGAYSIPGGNTHGGFTASGMTRVTQTLPTTVRGAPLGFDSGATLIAAAGTQTVTSRPQQAFRPEKLVIDSTIAPSFLLTDIKIGNTSMFLSTDSVPASVFIPNAEAVSLRWRTAQPAQDVSIDVTNISAGAARFLAAMTGTVAE